MKDLMVIYTGGNSVYKYVIERNSKDVVVVDKKNLTHLDELEEIIAEPFFTKKVVVVQLDAVYPFSKEDAFVARAREKLLKLVESKHERTKIILVTSIYKRINQLKKEVPSLKVFYGSNPPDKVMFDYFRDEYKGLPKAEYEATLKGVRGRFRQLDLYMEYICTIGISPKEASKLIKKKLPSYDIALRNLLLRTDMSMIFTLLGHYKHGYKDIQKYIQKKLEVYVKIMVSYSSGELNHRNMIEYAESTKKVNLSDVIFIMDNTAMLGIYKLEAFKSKISNAHTRLDFITEIYNYLHRRKWYDQL